MIADAIENGFNSISGFLWGETIVGFLLTMVATFAGAMIAFFLEEKKGEKQEKDDIAYQRHTLLLDRSFCCNCNATGLLSLVGKRFNGMGRLWGGRLTAPFSFANWCRIKDEAVDVNISSPFTLRSKNDHRLVEGSAQNMLLRLFASTCASLAGLPNRIYFAGTSWRLALYSVSSDTS